MPLLKPDEKPPNELFVIEDKIKNRVWGEDGWMPLDASGKADGPLAMWTDKAGALKMLREIKVTAPSAQVHVYKLRK